MLTSLWDSDSLGAAPTPSESGGTSLPRGRTTQTASESQGRAAHLRADDARGPWGAGLALETLWRESAPELAEWLPSEGSRPNPPPGAPNSTGSRLHPEGPLSCSVCTLIS